MLVFCQVQDPIRLCGEIVETLNWLLIVFTTNVCLILLKDIVISDKTLLQFGLPELTREQSTVINNRLYLSELAYDESQLIEVASVSVSKFNYDQEQMYKEVLSIMDSNPGYFS